MKKESLILILVSILSSLYGLLMITSASYTWANYKFGDSLYYTKHQVLFLILGVLCLFIFSKIDYHLYEKYKNKILLVSGILLVLVLIPGLGVVRNGARSWFQIGPFGIQPSEFSKIALMIYVSSYLKRNNSLLKDTKKGVLPILGILFLFFGLILLEPDFGQGMVIMLTLIGIIFIAGANLNFFFKLGILGILGIIVLIIIAPYRLARITSFLNPWQDPLGSGFQIIQSLYAIGPNGLLGRGLFHSIQSQFYLPEPQTDFIFAIICEELGFVGAFLVLALFFILGLTSFKIAFQKKDLFAKYLAFGLSFGILLQAILNLAVVTGLIPVTGVTLPFFSYGGSSLLITFSSIGILLNIAKQ